MINIFCEPEDDAALWLADVLTDRSEAVTVSLPKELLIGSMLSLRIGDGAPHPSALLASGAALSPDETTAIVARLPAFPQPDVPDATDADLVYGSEEARAALVGWFAAWSCPVVGRPDPYCPWGDGSPVEAWRLMAARSGIPTLAFGIPAAATREVLVTAAGAFAADGDPVESHLAARAGQLFELQGDAAAVFRFAETGDGPLFDAMVPMADFRMFGDALPELLIAGTGP